MSRHDRLTELFALACELDGAELERFLDERCRDGQGGADPELRAELERLLGRDRERPAGLPTPGPELVAAAVLELPSATAQESGHPERIGEYRIVGVLGRGGMGVVYEAEQEQPRRNVALKVVGAGFVTATLLRRFEHEAEVLGWLNHPGIAQIYEAGTHVEHGREQPFFAMELVRGAPLSQYATEHDLSLRSRLLLLAEICDAVHHAHQKGVIHRDLKPSNILVDQEGRAKVLDFGVARVADADLQATLHTRPGEVVGTLSYMAPEQVASDPAGIDTRADVYALGVIAYELLCGRRPHELTGLSLPAAARVIQDEEPPSLGALDRSLRGDVETIVAKALEKEKERRYASAEDLASDLRRFLAHEPIAARPPSSAYQLRKFARRNKALVGGVAATILALFAGLVVSLVLYFDAVEAREDASEAGAAADAARAKEQRQKEAALENLRRAVAAEEDALLAADNARTEARIAGEVKLFLTDLFEGADPNVALGREVTAKELLDRGAERIFAGLDYDPRAKADVMTVMGNVYRKLGYHAEAERLLEGALAVARELGADQHMALVNALLSIGSLRNDQKFPHGMIEAFDEVLELDTRVEVARQYRWTALSGRGEALAQLGNVEEAEAALRVVLEEAAPDDPTTGALYPSTQSALALVLIRRGRLDEAAALLLEVEAAFSRMYGDKSPKLAAVISNLAQVRFFQDRLDEAEELYLRALANSDELRGEHSDERVILMGSLARIASRRGDYDAAALQLEEVIAYSRENGQEKSGLMPIPLYELAGIRIRQGRHEQAMDLILESLDVFDLANSRDNPEREYLMRTVISAIAEAPEEASEPEAEGGTRGALLERALEHLESTDRSEDAQRVYESFDPPD